jgi:hypothetical protein
MDNEKLMQESNEVDLEMRRVQLALQKEQLAEINERKERRRAKLEKQAADIEANRRNRAQRQASCKHKKGGRNRPGLARGTDANYAVVVNTMPTGEVIVICQRCAKKWEAPTAELKRSDPAAFAIQMAEYRRALEFPTDNEPSGTQLFLITRHDDATRPSRTATVVEAKRKKKPRAA